MIGVDLGKRSFQLHGAREDGSAAFRMTVSRPSMRFVAVKSAEQQAEGMLFRTRDLPARQRTQTVNALRGHLAEHGVVAPQGVANVARLAAAVEDPETRCQ